VNAKFASECQCGTRIARGEAIHYVPGFAATHERCGTPTVATATRARRPRGRSTYYVRCTHEDYPCCGCER
jgi:hypothetical protein